MIRRLFRFAFLAGLVAAGVTAVKALTRKDDPLPSPAHGGGDPWPPLRPEPSTPPPAPAAAPAVAPEPDGVPVAATASDGAWVDPTTDGECPPTHPIKAKMSSKIFHAPGQLNYDRTTPDRCYRDAASAEADGLRAAKR